MSDFPYPYDAKLPPPAPNPSLRIGPLGIILAVFAGCFTLVNITVFPAALGSSSNTPVELWLTFGMGLIGAEAGLLAIAAVLGPGKGFLRHLLILPPAVAWIMGWLIGFGLAVWIYPYEVYFIKWIKWKEVAALLLVVPIVFCGCELPLWIVRTLLGWRIESDRHVTSRSSRPHLSISGILIATGAVAVALAAVRLGRGYMGGDISEAGWFGGCGIAVAFAGGISLTTLPLCTWATLRCPSLLAGVIAMIAWLPTVAFTLVCVISAIEGDWPPWDFWRPFTGIVFGFAFGILGTLSLVRIAGYRLLWGRTSRGTLISATSVATSEVPASPK